jgi:hypothetical protein
MPLDPAAVQAIVTQHTSYWDGQRPRMRDYKALYMTNFWDRDNLDQRVKTEVARAFATVESYIGALFARNPAVLVTPDLRQHGNPEVAEATANQYLVSAREQIEDATRLALIFPASFIKMAPTVSIDPLKRVETSALPPWEVIVDSTATSWDNQRWVGHIYLVPLEDAQARFKKDGWSHRTYTRWLDNDMPTNSAGGPKSESTTEMWVQIVEVFDLVADKLLVWSPDWEGGKEFVFTGVKVQVGALEPGVNANTSKDDVTVEMVHETTGIPYRSAAGTPVVPILPLYYSRDPETPLRGYSLIARIYDQLRDLNVLRTYQSNGVRRMARQWLVLAGLLDPDAQSKIAEGVDGEFIEVSAPVETDLTGKIIPVPQQPIPADIEQFAQQSEVDIQSAGVNAPFVSGSVTGVTATENRLLQEYTASQLGRMARTRDALIADMARVYNTMLSVILGEDAEPLTLPNPIGPTMLSADDLTGDFGYWAVDGGSTPMGDAVKRDNLLNLVPILQGLGAPAQTLLAELVRVYDLPQSFTEAVEAAAEVPLDADPNAEDPNAEDPNALPPEGQL